MHEIEGLAEDSIRFISNLKEITPQQKRTFFLNIYNWQAIFDTSYTHFRVKEFLEKQNFLLTLSLTDFQRFRTLKTNELLKIETEGYAWIKGPNTAEDVYADWNNGVPLFYFDYGSSTWSYLIEKQYLQDDSPVETWDTIELTHRIVKLAIEADKKTLAFEWYAAFVNCIHEEYIDYPTSFTTFLAHPLLIELKESIFEAGFSKYRCYDNLLEKPTWNDLKEDLNEEEDLYYSLKYLTNGRITKEKALKNYEQHLKTPKQPINVIRDGLAPFFNHNEWTLAEHEDENYCYWTWYKDLNPELGEHDSSFKRYVFSFEYHRKDAFLFVLQGIQMGKFLKWQNASPNHMEYAWHFRQTFNASLPGEVLDQNKFINDWGAWHIPLKKKLPFINKRIQDLTYNLEQYWSVYFDYITNLFNDNSYFKQDIDSLIDLSINGDENGFIPKHIAFDSPLSIYFAFIFRAIENDDKKLRDDTLQKAKAYLIDRDNLLTKIFLPQIKQLERNESINYPLHIHHPSLKHLKQQYEQEQ
ncbi:MAG: hypothetical protein N4A35_03640 [Flavobacteriales bacterium]|nr:hypothetical protein [Flavobacteriales bacterium]